MPLNATSTVEFLPNTAFSQPYILHSGNPVPGNGLTFVISDGGILVAILGLQVFGSLVLGFLGEELWRQPAGDDLAQGGWPSCRRGSLHSGGAGWAGIRPGRHTGISQAGIWENKFGLSGKQIRRYFHQRLYRSAALCEVHGSLFCQLDFLFSVCDHC